MNKGDAMSSILDLLKAVAGICKTQPLDQGLWNVRGSEITIDVKNIPELQKSDGAVYLKGQTLSVPVLVVRRQDNSYLCVENRCTHMGRKLDPEPGGILRCCSVSHATYDDQGNKLTGPAKGPVRIYRSREIDGKLVIDLT
jgi:nitrite reductase/ring-hydroxylating ferredoxin subunit